MSSMKPIHLNKEEFETEKFKEIYSFYYDKLSKKISDKLRKLHLDESSIFPSKEQNEFIAQQSASIVDEIFVDFIEFNNVCKDDFEPTKLIPIDKSKINYVQPTEEGIKERIEDVVSLADIDYFQRKIINIPSYLKSREWKRRNFRHPAMIFKEVVSILDEYLLDKSLILSFLKLSKIQDLFYKCTSSDEFFKKFIEKITSEETKNSILKTKILSSVINNFNDNNREISEEYKLKIEIKDEEEMFYIIVKDIVKTIVSMGAFVDSSWYESLYQTNISHYIENFDNTYYRRQNIFINWIKILMNKNKYLKDTKEESISSLRKKISRVR